MSTALVLGGRIAAASALARGRALAAALRGSRAWRAVSTTARGAALLEGSSEIIDVATGDTEGIAILEHLGLDAAFTRLMGHRDDPELGPVLEPVLNELAESGIDPRIWAAEHPDVMMPAGEGSSAVMQYHNAVSRAALALTEVVPGMAAQDVPKFVRAVQVLSTADTATLRDIFQGDLMRLRQRLDNPRFGSF